MGESERASEIEQESQGEGERVGAGERAGNEVKKCVKLSGDKPSLSHRCWLFLCYQFDQKKILSHF